MTATVLESATEQTAPVSSIGHLLPPVIETRNLGKRFGKVVALNDLNLDVPPAAIGLLGPNGAGKTTLIRLLLGLNRPTSGSASVLGLDAARDSIRIRELVGYMPESDCLPTNTTAADFVGHMAEMSGLPKMHARQRAADVLYQVGLDEERYRLIKGFSTGMKQRVKLAQAIVHDPKLVFLDEPTAGMDPQGRESMLDLVDRVYRMMGMTVVLSSHILEDIERVCDHVVIIANGGLILSQATGVGRGDKQELVVRIDSDPGRFAERLAEYGFTDVRQGSRANLSPFPELVVRFHDDRVYDAIRDTAADLDVPLRMMRTRALSLEDLYLDAVESGVLQPEHMETGNGQK